MSTTAGVPGGVEQSRARRSGVGLRAADLSRASPGYTLFTPQTADRTVYLIDLEGRVVHTWEAPYPPGLYGYLSERGTLLYNGRTEQTGSDFIAGGPWKGGALLEIDLVRADDGSSASHAGIAVPGVG